MRVSYHQQNSVTDFAGTGIKNISEYTAWFNKDLDFPRFLFEEKQFFRYSHPMQHTAFFDIFVIILVLDF